MSDVIYIYTAGCEHKVTLNLNFLHTVLSVANLLLLLHQHRLCASKILLVSGHKILKLLQYNAVQNNTTNSFKLSSKHTVSERLVTFVKTKLLY